MDLDASHAPMGTADRIAAIVEIAVVGLPFCAFKVLFGHFLTGSDVGGALAAGVALGALGALDAVLNLVNLLSLLSVRRRLVPICLASFVVGGGRRSSRADALGTALDMLLAFTLVAVSVGGGLLRRFDPTALGIWNVAVVVNVLGAGLLRVGAAMREGWPSTRSGPSTERGGSADLDVASIRRSTEERRADVDAGVDHR